MPVTLTRDYYIGETEVTQAEYLGMMGTNPSAFSACGPTCPVESVTMAHGGGFRKRTVICRGDDGLLFV